MKNKVLLLVLKMLAQIHHICRIPLVFNTTNLIPLERSHHPSIARSWNSPICTVGRLTKPLFKSNRSKLKCMFQCWNCKPLWTGLKFWALTHSQFVQHYWSASFDANQHTRVLAMLLSLYFWIYIHSRRHGIHWSNYWVCNVNWIT